MSKAMKIYNQYEVDMLLKGKADFNNFYKHELIQFLNRAREIIKEKENVNLKQALNEIREYIHSEEFFMFMNSGSQDDPNKSCCEDYFKAQGKLDQIIKKGLGEDNG